MDFSVNIHRKTPEWHQYAFYEKKPRFALHKICRIDSYHTTNTTKLPALNLSPGACPHCGLMVVCYSAHEIMFWEMCCPSPAGVNVKCKLFYFCLCLAHHWHHSHQKKTLLWLAHVTQNQQRLFIFWWNLQVFAGHSNFTRIWLFTNLLVQGNLTSLSHNK